MEAILNNSVQENLLMSIGEKNDFESRRENFEWSIKYEFFSGW